MRLSVDLFLVTYPQDYDWLPYLFRSIARYVTGFDRLVVVLEEGDPEPAMPAGAVVRRCPRYPIQPKPKNLTGANVIARIKAWEYSGADRVVNIDSDHVFCRPVDLRTDPAIMQDGRPLVLYEPWADVGLAQCWHDKTAKLLGFEPPFETMRRAPWCYQSWFLRRLWEHLGGEEMLLVNVDACEYNLAGNFAIARYPDDFVAMNVRQAPPACIRQFWSWHRPTHPAVQAELGRLGLT